MSSCVSRHRRIFIGLPLDRGVSKDIIMKINPYNSKELRYLHLPSVVTVLKNDPDLATVPEDVIPQTLYVVTGCDYTSFFSGIGKVTFTKYFYQYSGFITGGTEQAL